MQTKKVRLQLLDNSGCDVLSHVFDTTANLLEDKELQTKLKEHRIVKGTVTKFLLKIENYAQNRAFMQTTPREKESPFAPKDEGKALYSFKLSPVINEVAWYNEQR